jgi:hypothetical protein
LKRLVAYFVAEDGKDIKVSELRDLIITHLPEKKKDFPKHIVDPEVDAEAVDLAPLGHEAELNLAIARRLAVVELHLESQTWQGVLWKHQLLLIEPERVDDPTRVVVDRKGVDVWRGRSAAGSGFPASGPQTTQELARKGIEIEREPVKIQLQTHFISYHYPFLYLRIACSKGTYIRSIAHDLGQRLGCGAHLSALQRTRLLFEIVDCLR